MGIEIKGMYQVLVQKWEFSVGCLDTSAGYHLFN